MQLDEKVTYIKNAINKNKLIIFVGAGVSKNSNLPDWGQLIKVFVDKLNYPNSDVKTLSTDEYLKITQYYCNIHGNEAYEKVIKEILDIDAQPNEIHELIFKLNPTHIITTNYDRLLESTATEKRMLFDTISNDKDLLDSKKSNYIIKMHGDIKNLENIVLKENDYLNYSQNHILIETYIKSLLVNHTFLFIGYRLNDYNLKQIISWVDYLAKGYTGITDRPKHFIIQETDEEYRLFIEDDYKQNNIFVINPNEINLEYINSISSKLTSDPGKKLYGTLMYIKNYPHQTIDKLYYGSLQLKKMRRVSIEDLFKIYRFKGTEVLSGDTLYFPYIDQTEYLVIKNIISGKTDKEILVKETLIKSGLRYITIVTDAEIEKYNLLDNYNPINDEFDELHELEMQCDYLKIDKAINLLDNKNTKAFYLFKLQEFNKAIQYLEEIKHDILDKEVYDLLLYKFNLGLLNQLVSFNANYLNKLFNGNAEQKLQLSNLKEKHLKTYLKLDNSLQLRNIQYNLHTMMSIVYDYYFYIKKNGICLDYFSDMERFFEPYIESILSTYSPKTRRIRTTTVFPDYNEYSNYILNRYDWDILIKHTDYKKIEEYLKKYEINKIEYDRNFNIITILSNLCQYIKSKRNRYNIKYLKNFILLLTVINFDKKDVNEIVKILEDVLITKEQELDIFIFTQIGKDLSKFIDNNKQLINRNSFEIVIAELFKQDVYNKLNNVDKTRFLNSVKDFSYNLYKDKIDKIIEENNFQYILGLNRLISTKQWEIVSSNLSNNIDTIDVSTIIRFIFINIIEYNEIIENKLLDKLKTLVSNKVKNPALQTFPDPLEDTLNDVIILFLLNKGVNIEKFKEYTKYHDILEFIFNPSHFEYEKIALDNYNWMNIMKNENFLNIIINQGKTVMQKKLKYNIDNGFANEEQTRLYYKYFE